MSWWNPFRQRKPAPPAPDEPPAEDWRVGDLAECVHDGGWWRGSIPATDPSPSFGDRYVVREVRVSRSRAPHMAGALVLGFARFAPRVYKATAFRKITPRADALRAADGEFVERLRERVE